MLALHFRHRINGAESKATCITASTITQLRYMMDSPAIQAKISEISGPSSYIVDSRDMVWHTCCNAVTSSIMHGVGSMHTVARTIFRVIKGCGMTELKVLK